MKEQFMDKSIDVNEILKKAAALYDEKKFSEAVELWKSIEVGHLL